jgi:hypothetical protein
MRRIQQQEAWMRRILMALKAMLASFVKGIDGVWRFVFGSGGGGDYMIDDDDGAPDPAAEKSVESARTTPPEPDEHAVRTARRHDAALVRTWALTTLTDGRRPPLAPCLSRVVRDWLPGLDAGELTLIADATPDQVLQHLATGPYIAGLHRVQRLPPAPLDRKTGPVIDHDDGPRDVADLRAALASSGPGRAGSARTPAFP